MPLFTTQSSRIPHGCDEDVAIASRHDNNIFRCGMSKQGAVCQDIDVDERNIGAVVGGVCEIDQRGEGQRSLASVQYLQVADLWRKGADTASFDGYKGPHISYVSLLTARTMQESITNV